MVRAEEFVKLVWTPLLEGWGYIYGTAGRLWTEELQRAWSAPPHKNWEKTKQYGARWIGKKVTDCSGLPLWTKVTPTGENALLIWRNPLFPDNSPLVGTLGENLRTALTGASWQALSITWRWEPAAQLGTPLEVTTKDGNVIRSVLCGQTL